ncbi:MAG TPA: lytic transglycosylase domain-containing protein [Thermoanaerobaculia bacterium]|jgi:soluble lytic murein transglycosylase-like protein|nr:lytic transglycosylase domain-containing protein [Thermoanaerobaculia bacterium]
MKMRAFVLAGILAAAAAAASAQVRVVVRNGRHVIFNDGPANLGASESWLAARMRKASAYDDLIAAAARENSVDPKLIKSVMLIESDFNPAAISKKGARGLMQLMPEVAAEHGVSDVHDPKQNIVAGTRQLSRLMTYYAGDLVKSLAAYNAGEAAVDRYAGVPPYAETQLYVRKALAAYYGKSTLGGGFGKPAAETFRGIPAAEGRPVQWVRDARTNRVTLTTKARPAPRRLG